jgi:hypothetical protein
MRFKGYEFTGIDQMLNDENDKRLQAAWVNSLERQIPGVRLPDYMEIKNSIKNLLVEKLA